MPFLTAAKIKSEMYMQGITQKQLAEMLGVSASYITVTSSTVRKQEGKHRSTPSISAKY